MDIFSHFVFTIAIISPILGMEEFKSMWKTTLVIIGVNILLFSSMGMSMLFLICSGLVSFIAMMYFVYKSYQDNEIFFLVFCSLFGAIFISSFSHIFDYVWIYLESIPPMTSPIRPQNLWHTIPFAISLSLLSAILLNYSRKDKKLGFSSIFSSIFLGYLFHIFTDSLTYDFDIWWGFPFSDIHFSLYDLANSGFLLMESTSNPWGWSYYYITTPLLIFALAYSLLIYIIRREISKT